MKINKRAQHEIFGFVLIVLIVSIIIVIFLSLAITKGRNAKQNSIEVSNLLSAVMYYTTECTTTWIPQYKDCQDLIKECYKNPEKKCLNGENVCESLERTLKEIIEPSLMIGESSPNKAYKLTIYYNPLNDIETKDEIAIMQSGIFEGCSIVSGGMHMIELSTFTPGTLNLELELCSG